MPNVIFSFIAMSISEDRCDSINLWAATDQDFFRCSHYDGLKDFSGAIIKVITVDRAEKDFNAVVNAVIKEAVNYGYLSICKLFGWKVSTKKIN